MKYLFLLMSLFFLMLAGGSMANSGATNAEVPDKTLIDLFVEWQAHGNGTGDLREEATEYVLKYYPTRDAALEMLKKNGFKVTVKEFEPDHYSNYGFGNKKEHFDETFYGWRPRSIRRFWEIFASYSISVYMNNGKVIRVVARVESSML